MHIQFKLQTFPNIYFLECLYYLRLITTYCYKGVWLIYYKDNWFPNGEQILKLLLMSECLYGHAVWQYLQLVLRVAKRGFEY